MGLFKSLFGGKKEEAPVQKKFPIVCPHCFNKFSPDTVVFRAAHSKEEDEEYCLQEDAKLNEYLERFGLEGSEELEAVLNPYLVPAENRHYVDDVLISMKDKYNVETKKRLCPYCHNDLPYSAGRAPSNIIAIIGASQVGKSVYMASLINTLENVTAHNFEAACLPINSDTSRRFRSQYLDPLFLQNSLIESTQKERKQEPFIFQFKFKDPSKEPLSLVFFDVAGEGMVEEEYLDLYANHIRNAEGILFLVDPLQLSTIRRKLILNQDDNGGDFTSQYQESRDVVVTLAEHFIGSQEDGKTSIPTAVVITKSDMLTSLAEEEGEYIKPNSNVFENYIHKGYFNLNEYENINGEVQRFLEKVDLAFKDAVEVHFKNVSYFAVSSLGQNPVEGKLEKVIQPMRIDEPFLWLLYKLGYISSNEGVR
ncbi:TRAFAC clade GTPase domain-containing protein [Cellulosilyticum lentocellum]|uniref:Double-GTPase 2 domain-containing protein n=1 Tax=Cellulosilyticum lentocellum (strain ATCC 49066 / DSM 5427 / NCIMB 11756 / RHM5) TaxID=642492 RepID=F2JMZ5_CELLD|nr:hypothetical protein [Cellulosilyticum lentocellum]ADZ82337.1 hypothetical protein Clole_0603 [Cellulosilyticum lentocellum DSM 5427]